MFHQLTASWPVEVEDGGYVRLYDRNGNLLALVSEPQRIRTIFFDPDGTVLEEQVLLEHPWINIEPRTAVLASLPDGSQYLGLVSDKTAQLMAVDPQGVPLNQEHNLLWDVAETIPDFDLSAPLGSFTVGRISGDGLVDNLTVTSEGGPLIQNDFTSDDLTGSTRFERDPEGPELCGSGDEDPECEYVFVPVTTENGYVKSFNGKLRDKLLNGEIFTTLQEAKVLTEVWRRSYNEVRPHSSQSYKPPHSKPSRDRYQQPHPNSRLFTGRKCSSALVPALELMSVKVLTDFQSVAGR